MKNVLGLLITIFVFALWFLPLLFPSVYDPSQLTGWAAIYVPIVPVTVGWGVVLVQYFFKNQGYGSNEPME